MGQKLVSTDARVRLIAPRDGEITPPLQMCAWEDFRHEYEDGGSPPLNRGFPSGLHLVWENPASAALDGRRYDLALGTDPGLAGARRWNGLAQTTLELFDLLLGTRYYWQVTEKRRGKVTAQSPVGWFDTHPRPPRWLSAHGLVNLRDAGGWAAGAGKRVRQGRIYRSAEINNHHRLTPAARRHLTETLGVRLDVDLRGPEEKPGPALTTARVAYLNAPVDAYDHITLPFSREGYRRAFSALARAENYPALVHCWGGADRTGTLIFLLNGWLGVSKDDLLLDYEATSLSGVGRRLSSSIEFQKMLGVLQSYASGRAPLTAQIEGYLTAIGVTSEELAALRANLIETV
jgi:protein-tyrosine phosphatase